MQWHRPFSGYLATHDAVPRRGTVPRVLSCWFEDEELPRARIYLVLVVAVHLLPLAAAPGLHQLGRSQLAPDG